MWSNSCLILYPQIEAAEGDHFKISPLVNKAGIRSSLLYFQEILYVPYAFSFMQISMNLVDDEVHTLLEQGLVSRLGDRHIKIPRLNKEFFANDAKALYSGLNTQYPEKMYVSSQPISEEAGSEMLNSIYCRIENSLPVPSHDTPIPDIIQFRNENQKLLDRFSRYIEKMGGLVSAGIIDLDHVIADLADDLDRLTDSLKQNNMYGGKVDFGFSNVVDAGLSKVVSAGLAMMFGLSDAASSTLARSIKFAPRKGPQVAESNQFPRQYEYLIDAGRSRLFDGAAKDIEPDDWQVKEANDENNTFRFVFPPADTPIIVPSGGFSIKNSLHM